MTIGTRAASKVLVQAARVIIAFLLLSGSARAQAPAAPKSSDEPFKIADNSFLVEEAFNQEGGIFQNIFGAMRVEGEWAATFTQEWPLESQTHQFSYTVGWLDAGAHTGVGDALINYRYQAATEGPGRPAFSPRLSLILPTGSTRRGLGSGSAGLQFNLPVSKRTGDWYWHGNGGATWLPRAHLVSPFLAGSAIYRLQPMLHLMMESVISFDESVVDGGSARTTTFTLSPGFRGGWNVGDTQVIVGFALPVSWDGDANSTGAFIYFSYELPFGK